MKKPVVTRDALKADMEGLFRSYREAVEPYFASLDAGLSDEQFEALRANYFYRIATTPALIAGISLRALLRRDWECARSTIDENLGDELGDLTVKSPHLALLSYAFNSLGQRCFKLAPLEVAILNGDPQAKGAPPVLSFITPETRAFRYRLNELLNGGDDLALLGASYAQEFIAFETLTRLQKLFLDRPPKEPMSPPEDEYFIVHLGKGDPTAKAASLAREKVHAAHALNNLNRSCQRSPRKGARQSALRGAKEFLDAQRDLFLSLPRK